MGRVSHTSNNSLHILHATSVVLCFVLLVFIFNSKSNFLAQTHLRHSNKFHVGMQMDINHHLQMHQSAELTMRKQIYFRNRRGKGSSLCLCMLDTLWVCQNPRTNFGLEFHVLCTSYKEFLSRHHTPCTISSLCKRLPTTQLSLGYDKQAIIH